MPHHIKSMIENFSWSKTKDDLISKLDNLKLDLPNPHPPARPELAGGFDTDGWRDDDNGKPSSTSMPGNTPAYGTPSRPPRPFSAPITSTPTISMPVPDTTPYPLIPAAPPTPAQIPNPPNSNGSLAPFSFDRPPPSSSTPNLLPNPWETPPRPKPPRRSRTSSDPPSPTASETPSAASSSDAVQCGGVTKSGKQCTRLIKAPHPLSYISPGEPIERFCFQHTKELLLPTGFYSRAQPTEWIKFEDWIPDYLTPETKAALRVEMEKPSSDKDEPGYIYTYEIRKGPNQVLLKVGRAVNLVKRIDEWSKQCGSKEVILRGWWPGTVEEDTSLIKGRVKAGEKGKYCHRLERLVHLELADLSLNGQYLTPAFFDTTPSAPSPDADDTLKSPSKGKMAKIKRETCPDCGTVHKEIFTFSRVKSGKLKGREWEGIVKPIIEKWGGFVEHLV